MSAETVGQAVEQVSAPKMISADTFAPVTRKVNLARGEHWPPRPVPWSAEVRQG